MILPPCHLPCDFTSFPPPYHFSPEGWGVRTRWTYPHFTFSPLTKNSSTRFRKFWGLGPQSVLLNGFDISNLRRHNRSCPLLEDLGPNKNPNRSIQVFIFMGLLLLPLTSLSKVLWRTGKRTYSLWPLSVVSSILGASKSGWPTVHGTMCEIETCQCLTTPSMTPVVVRYFLSLLRMYLRSSGMSMVSTIRHRSVRDPTFGCHVN